MQRGSKMRSRRGWSAAPCALVILAVVLSGGGSSKKSSSSAGSGGAAKGKPILIGAAIDFTALMAPTDDPALYGAEIEARKINAQGGVDGHKIQFDVANTHLKPDQT